MEDKKGLVYIAGAGCGGAELLTLRVAELLKSCDALVYDDLIDGEILNLAPESCSLIYMGKRSGKHSAAQEEISEKLVSLAKEGKTVLRLKGGDPFVFGRGGEEILALQKAGIPFEELPGISSAVAIPASAGIPVTHRGLSRSFHVITAHSAEGESLPEDLPELAKLHGTLIFLMGLGKLPYLAEGLIKEGMSGDTPAAVISGGNSLNPGTVRGCLADIAEKTARAGLKPPAVIVVGKTAAMDLKKGAAEKPLEGIRVGLTGTDSLTEKLGKALREKGAATELVERSLIEELDFSPEIILNRDKIHWLVFTSANGVRIFFKKLQKERIDLRQLSSCRFGVIGAPTGKLLSEYGIYPELCPEIYTSAELGALLCKTVQPGQDVILLRAENGAVILPEMLREKKIPFRDIALYRLKTDEALSERKQGRLEKLDYLCFSSAGGVRLFVSCYGSIPLNPVCVCIGKITAEELKKYSGRPFITAESSSVESMTEAIISHIRK